MRKEAIVTRTEERLQELFRTVLGSQVSIYLDDEARLDAVLDRLSHADLPKLGDDEQTVLAAVQGLRSDISGLESDVGGLRYRVDQLTDALKIAARGTAGRLPKVPAA